MGVFRRAEHVFEDYFGATRHVDDQETISSLILVCSVVLTVPDSFCYAEHAFEECFGAERHADVQEIPFARI